MKYIKHPIKITEAGRKVLRARLSLRETQKEFAERMRVHSMTISNWELGRVTRLSRIYREILDAIIERLRAEGKLLPDEAITVTLKGEVEKRGRVIT